MVDDSNLLLKIATAHLQKAGHTVITAQNGQEAVDKARAEKPDIIFLDAEMPVMDGLEACQILKKDESTKAIPVYMYTGHDLEGEEAKQFALAGANGCLQKPYKPDEMYDRINKIVR